MTDFTVQLLLDLAELVDGQCLLKHAIPPAMPSWLSGRLSRACRCLRGSAGRGAGRPRLAGGQG
jgi:hypothetical protein